MPAPTTRYTITAHHPAAMNGKPLVVVTYDVPTVERMKGQLADLGYERVEVIETPLAASAAPATKANSPQ